MKPKQPSTTNFESPFVGTGLDVQTNRGLVLSVVRIKAATSKGGYVARRRTFFFLELFLPELLSSLASSDDTPPNRGAIASPNSSRKTWDKA
jgi:hypothetical protein